MSDESSAKKLEAQNPESSTIEAKNIKKKPILRKLNPLLWLTVVLPTAISTVYFGVVASDRYISESSFVVRSARNQTSLSGLGALLQNSGFSRSQDDTHTVQSYLTSRSALQTLEKQLPVRSFYEKEGDWFSRFNALGMHNSQEKFYQYFKKHVSIDLDTISGISILRVEAFNPKEAAQINSVMLKKAEDLINQLNARARRDTIAFSEQNLKHAQEKANVVAKRFMEYRTNNGIFDLKEQSGVQLGLISKLQDELIMIQTQLDQVRSITPDNPQITGLKAREKSLQQEIAAQMKRISGKGAGSIASKAAEYQQLYLENQLAEKELASAMASLESARMEANRQQLYLEVVAQPSEPDVAQLPERIYNIVSTFVLGLITYGILSLLTASIREHKN